MLVLSLSCSSVFKRRVVVAAGAVDNLKTPNYLFTTKSYGFLPLCLEHRAACASPVDNFGASNHLHIIHRIPGRFSSAYPTALLKSRTGIPHARPFAAAYRPCRTINQ
jgi:hypothetical protein